MVTRTRKALGDLVWADALVAPLDNGSGTYEIEIERLGFAPWRSEQLIILEDMGCVGWRDTVVARLDRLAWDTLEVLLACRVLNTMTSLGMPDSYRVE
jgi:hypothetical protein